MSNSSGSAAPLPPPHRSHTTAPEQTASATGHLFRHAANILRLDARRPRKVSRLPIARQPILLSRSLASRAAKKPEKNHRRTPKPSPESTPAQSPSFNSLAGVRRQAHASGFTRKSRTRLAASPPAAESARHTASSAVSTPPASAPAAAASPAA